MPARRDDDVEREPVTCNKCGHFNDPYPTKTGRCTECSGWLEKNPYVLQSDDMDGISEQRVLRDKEIDKRAKKYITDAGGIWAEAPAFTQDIAIRFASTKDRHDGEFLARQLKMLQAKPKSTEDFAEAEIVVNVDMGAMGDTLKVLDALSRD